VPGHYWPRPPHSPDPLALAGTGSRLARARQGGQTVPPKPVSLSPLPSATKARVSLHARLCGRRRRYGCAVP